MKFTYLPLENSKQLPFILRYVEAPYLVRHWHTSVEITLVVSGEVTVIVDNKKYILKEKDMFIFNVDERHEIYSKKCKLAVIHIPYDFLSAPTMEGLYPGISKMRFGILPKTGNRTKLNRISKVFTQMIEIYSEQRDGYRIRLLSKLYELIYLTVMDWQAEGSISTEIKVSAIEKCLKYVDSNYKDNISLKDISDMSGYTIQYISRLFKQNTSLTFMEYLNLVRLKNAYYDMVSTTESITFIAGDNGFSSAKYFNKVFRSYFGTTPGEFRKTVSKNMSYDELHKNLEENLLKIGGDRKNDYTLETLNNIAVPEGFLVYPKEADPFKKDMEKLEYKITVGKKHSITIEEPLGNMIYFGQAQNLVFSEYQDCVRQIKKDLGYRYIYLSGLISSKSEEDIVRDSIVTFLAKEGLCPSIEVNKPADGKDIGITCTTLNRFILRLKDRFRPQEFLGTSIAMYSKGYSEIRDMIKSIDSFIKTGIILDYNEYRDIEHIKYTIYEYRDEIEFIIIKNNMGEPLWAKEQDFISSLGVKVFDITGNEPLSFRKNDSCVRALSLVKNYSKSVDNKYKYIDYKAVDDQTLRKDDIEVFYGDKGILTKEGVKKAAFYALLFINALEGGVILNDKGLLCIKNKNSFYILLFDCHEDGQDKNDLNFKIELKGLKTGLYEITENRINADSGSAFEKWAYMGSPSWLSTKLRENLMSLSVPHMAVTEEYSTGELVLDIVIERNEICLIEMEFLIV